MIKKNSFRCLLSLGLVSTSSFAQETATVLPQSIFRGRVVSIFAPSISDQFNQNGKKEALAAAYDGLEVKMADLALVDSNVEGLKTALEGNGLGALIPMLDSTLAVSAKINVQQYTTAFEYGLTKKLSLGVIVPVVKMEATSSFAATNQHALAKQIIDGSAANGSPLEDGVDSYIASTTLDGLGYTAPATTSFTGLGDIEIGGKYQFLNTGKMIMAFQAGARLPTATHQASQSNIFDRSSGDKQLDLAAQWMGEYRVNSNLFFGSSAKYTVQTADTQDRFVKASATDFLADLNNPALRDTNIKRDLGDIVDAEVSVNYEFGDDAYKTWGVYEYSAQGTDKYTGTKSLDYASLGTNTNTVSHRLSLGMGYSTIPAFARNKFPVPMEIKASYSFPVSGKNITNSQYSRLDLIAYF
jgi:hypothetical protein